MKTFLSLCLCVSTYSAIGTTAQEPDSLWKQIEKIVKTKSPEGSLVQKHERGKVVTYVWGRHNQADIMVTIFYGDSKVEAADWMAAAIDRLSMGPGKKRNDIGDEAYFWESRTGSSAGIRFRKGSVYIDMVAASSTMAEDLTKKVVELIQKN